MCLCSEDVQDATWNEAEAYAVNKKVPASKMQLPPARTRAREMDLIRLLLARVAEFKEQWQTIKREPWKL
jgi:ABC-type Fe3+ transport system substrate-binding protein